MIQGNFLELPLEYSSVAFSVVIKCFPPYLSHVFHFLNLILLHIIKTYFFIQHLSFSLSFNICVFFFSPCSLHSIHLLFDTNKILLLTCLAYITAYIVRGFCFVLYGFFTSFNAGGFDPNVFFPLPEICTKDKINLIIQVT